KGKGYLLDGAVDLPQTLRRERTRPDGNHVAGGLLRKMDLCGHLAAVHLPKGEYRIPLYLYLVAIGCQRDPCCRCQGRSKIHPAGGLSDEHECRLSLLDHKTEDILIGI